MNTPRLLLLRPYQPRPNIPKEAPLPDCSPYYRRLGGSQTLTVEAECSNLSATALGHEGRGIGDRRASKAKSHGACYKDISGVRSMRGLPEIRIVLIIPIISDATHCVGRIDVQSPYKEPIHKARFCLRSSLCFRILKPPEWKCYFWIYVQ
jgi:hypothetical protein